MMPNRIPVSNTGLRKYSHSVYKAVAEYWGLPLDDYAMDIIDMYDKERVLADFLKWEGIFGYTDAIMSIINA